MIFEITMCEHRMAVWRQVTRLDITIDSLPVCTKNRCIIEITNTMIQPLSVQTGSMLVSQEMLPRKASRNASSTRDATLFSPRGTTATASGKAASKFEQKAMAVTDPDPVIMKGLRLLQSKSPDSGLQLYNLFKEVLDQRRGIKSSAPESDLTLSRAKVPSSKSDEKKKEAEKRSHDKLSSDNGDSGLEAKKIKLEEAVAELEDRDKRKEKEKQEQLKRKQEKEKELEEEEEEEEKEESEKDELERQYDESTDEEASMGVDNFAMEMGLACVVCNQIGVGLNPNLIECQECHKLYHRECHRPPITEEEVDDPRNVWYCSRCSKNLKKMAAKSTKSKSSASSREASGGSGAKSAKSEPSVPTSMPFRRATDKMPTSKESSSSSSSSSKVPMSGLATLAHLATRSDSKSSSSRSEQSRSGKTSSAKSGSSKSSSLKSETSGRTKGSKSESGGKSKGGEKGSEKTSGLSRSNSTSGSLSKQSVGEAVIQANKRMQQMKKKAQVQSQHKKEHYK